MSGCGTVGGYRAHSRAGTPTCRGCMDAAAAWQREYVKRRYLTGAFALIDGTGTRRRLQALVASGWPQSHLAARLGTDPQNLSNVIHGRRSSRVTGETFRAVCDLFDALWDQVPAGGPSVRAVRLAARYGWVRPLMWDDIDDPAASPASTSDIDTVDELAVEAVLEGVRLQLAGATAHAAVHALHARGVPAAVVAERIGIQERQVERLKARDTAPHRKTNNYLGETA